MTALCVRHSDVAVKSSVAECLQIPCRTRERKETGFVGTAGAMNKAVTMLFVLALEAMPRPGMTCSVAKQEIAPNNHFLASAPQASMPCAQRQRQCQASSHDDGQQHRILQSMISIRAIITRQLKQVSLNCGLHALYSLNAAFKTVTERYHTSCFALN